MFFKPTKEKKWERILYLRQWRLRKRVCFWNIFGLRKQTYSNRTRPFWCFELLFSVRYMFDLDDARWREAYGLSKDDDWWETDRWQRWVWFIGLQRFVCGYISYYESGLLWMLLFENYWMYNSFCFLQKYIF